jgi:lipid II:glycine glycyltransferase (peptidoglycan interpeptide bridge formation enzyme)
LSLSAIDDSAEWDGLLHSFSAPHLLQSWTWGELKSRFGWTARRLAWAEPDGAVRAAAQLLFRTERGLTLAYCPKGPVVDWAQAELRDRLLSDLIGQARARGAFVLKIDPEVHYGEGPGAAVEGELRDQGWRRAPDPAQFRNTLLLDLRQSEETLLSGMKQKWRYNLRLAQRHGVQVREGGPSDLELLYRMYAETSQRDGFVIRSREYYLDSWRTFMERGQAQPLIAEVDGEPVAGFVVYVFGKTAWYLYGMSTHLHREKMPNHLLHWEAIRWAKAHGCEAYDFVGAPDKLNERDPMWGVHRFKEGFGGRFVETIGEWDYPLRPLQYWASRLVLPRLLSVMRVLGRRRVAAEVG